MTQPAIDKFVTDIKAVVASTTDPASITEQVAALAKPLADDKSWIEQRCFETDDDQGIGITILHTEPDDTLLIETVCWQAGRGVAPHDHQTWGVVIGLDGEEINRNWRRNDDGSKAGYADISVAEEIAVGCGDVICLMPNDIHSVRNDGATNSLSLHIYGRDLATTGRSEFNPIAKTEQPCPQRKRNR